MKIGDKVKFSEGFLESLSHESASDFRGEITDINDDDPKYIIVYVLWDGAEVSNPSLSSNIEVVE